MTNRHTMQSKEIKQTSFSYGYIIVSASFVILMLVFGAQYSYGVFFKYIQKDFGWTRAMISGAYSLNIILFGVFSIVSGRLADKFGPRLVTTISGLSLGLGYLLLSRINAIWQIYLFFGVLLSIGSAGTLVPLMSNVARWFDKKRGLMSGIVAAGIGIGTVVIPLVSSQLILNFDWRKSYVIIGLIALFVVVVSAQFLKSPPVKAVLPAVDARIAKKEVSDIQTSGLSFREATSKWQFWKACLMFLCTSFCVQTVLVHMVPYATDRGMDPTVAATLLSVLGWTSIFGKIGIGNVADWLGNKRAMTITIVFILTAFVWVLLSGKIWMLYPFAGIIALGYGGEAVSRSPLVAEFFGLKAHGEILGLLMLVGSIGGALGPFIAGKIFDVSGSYNHVFMLCAGISIAGLILSLLLKPAKSQTKPDMGH